MSKELPSIKETGRNHDRDLSMTHFFGGITSGPMIQLTQGEGNSLDKPDEPGFIQLTKDDAKRVINQLTKWLKGKESYENFY